MSKLPWSERVPALSVNPHAADASDVALLAAELMTANAEVARLTQERDEARSGWGAARRLLDGAVSSDRHNEEMDAERARAEAAEGQVAALREALKWCHPHPIMWRTLTPDDRARWSQKVDVLLADTALGAQQHDERIWKEAIASVECNAVPGSSQALATPPAIQTIGGVSGGDPSREHDDRIRREALEEAADAVERWTRADGYAWERDMGESLGAGIRALMPPAGNPNEAASGQIGQGKASASVASAPTPKPQTGSSMGTWPMPWDGTEEPK